MAGGPLRGSGEAGLGVASWVVTPSDLRTLRKFEGIFDFDAEIAHGALILGMAEQDLNSADYLSPRR
jgi:hypothetical protein